MSWGREVVTTADELLKLGAICCEVDVEIETLNWVWEEVATHLGTNFVLPS